MGNYVGFLVCAIIIFFAGKKLSVYGDKIADKTGLGKAWIGLILMASITSLPELMVGVSTSAFIQSADLAVGDVLGSCTFNLAILAMLDIFVPHRQSLFNIASSRHVLSASLGIILVALVGLGLFLPEQIVIIPGIGLISAVCIVIYLFSIRLIYFYELAGNASDEVLENEKMKDVSLKSLIVQYIFYASIIVVAAFFVPYFADIIAEESGLGKSFMGTFFVAASTSLPEVAVSIAAVRMGSVDLAVGNLLGSNLFNILILTIDDALYTKGVILKDASDINTISAFSVIIMSAIVISGFTYKAKTKKFWMASGTILILFFYVVNMVLIYTLNK